MTLFVILLLLSISFLQHGAALQVTPGSTCAAFCLDNPESDPLNPDSSNTRSSDITCTDDSFDNTATGIKFKNCLDCLQKSNATSNTESDVSWFLYNIRYSVDVCLFGFPNASSEVISSPCTINWGCQPLKKALEAGSLDSRRDQFEYCTADGDFLSSNNVDDCIQCFASSPNQGHLSNFMTALKAGCEQKPAPGELIGLSDSLFTGSSVNITTPPSDAMSNSKDNGFGITSTGAIVGISLGAGLLLLGGVALFWIYRRRQKRLFGETFNPHDDPRTGNRSITPLIGGRFSANEKRAPSQTSDHGPRAQNNFTSNAEYYKMLERGVQPNQQHYTVGPNNPRSNPQSVLPAHPAYLPRTHSRQASREPSPPRPTKANKPDSYALQAYLSAAEDAGGVSFLPPPPPGPPPPVAVTGDPSRFRGPSLSQYAHNTRDSSMDSRGPSPDRRPLLKPTLQSTASISNPPPPPPPSRSPKVPFLAFPSVSRVRIPKKYTPPIIAVQAATPIDDPVESGSNSNTQHAADLSIGLGISKPMVPDE
ncbi:hypothetical protein GGR58DRAFT_490326 [Xylaria digitata]|nr:hypothetical protein GGR58DRAFT_490326 [Xylaria digitata]